jgi:hypothetical protein
MRGCPSADGAATGDESMRFLDALDDRQVDMRGDVPALT